VFARGEAEEKDGSVERAVRDAADAGLLSEAVNEPLTDFTSMSGQRSCRVTAASNKKVRGSSSVHSRAGSTDCTLNPAAVTRAGKAAA